MAQFQSSGVTGSLDVTTNITASGHISASIFYGDGSGLSGVSAGGLSAVVDDPAPQLGGTLDVNGQAISGSTVSLISDTVELTGSNFIFGRNTYPHGLVYTPTILTMRHNASSVTVGQNNVVTIGDAELRSVGFWANSTGSPWNLIDGKNWCFRANDTTGYYLYLGTSGSPKVVVTGSSLGIGTDTPSASLDVVGTFRTSGSSNQMTGSTQIELNEDSTQVFEIKGVESGTDVRIVHDYFRVESGNAESSRKIYIGRAIGDSSAGASRYISLASNEVIVKCQNATIDLDNSGITTTTYGNQLWKIDSAQNYTYKFQAKRSGEGTFTTPFEIDGDNNAATFIIRPTGSAGSSDITTAGSFLVKDTSDNEYFKVNLSASSNGGVESILSGDQIRFSGSTIQMTGSVNITGSGNEQFVISNIDSFGASKKILRTKMYNSQPILQLYNGGNFGLVAYGHTNAPVIGANGLLTIRKITNQDTAAGTDMAKFDFNNSIFQVTGSLSITGSSGGTIQSSLDSNGTGSLRLFTDGTQINPFISLTAWSGSFPFKFAYISTGTETGASEPSASLSLSHYPPLAGGVATLTSSLHTDIKGKHVRLNTDQTDNTYTVTSDDLYVDGKTKLGADTSNHNVQITGSLLGIYGGSTSKIHMNTNSGVGTHTLQFGVFHKIESNPGGGNLDLYAGYTGGGHYLRIYSDNTQVALFRKSYIALTSSNIQMTGSLLATGSINVKGSGSTLLKVEGSQGDLFSVTDSLSGSLFSVNDISGLPVLEAFSDNTIVMGDFAAPSLTTTARATINSPGGYVFSIPTGTYDGYYIDYTVVSSSLGDMRAGQIITIRSGSSYHYTEQTTTDFGSTTAVTFNVEASGSNVSLYATASSGTYTVKAIVRAI